MDFSFSETLPREPELIFRLLRDDLPRVAPHIPDIESVEVLERTEEDGVVRLRNRWTADVEIPRLVRAVVEPEMLTWIDRNEWDESDLSCTWTFEPPAFGDHVDCRGVNLYRPAGGGGTRLESEGDLEVDLAGFPGIPRFAAGSIGKRVEAFVVKLVTPNLARLAEGIRSFLDSPDGTEYLAEQDRRGEEAGEAGEEEDS